MVTSPRRSPGWTRMASISAKLGLKVSPLLDWNDKQMNDYCKQHDLPVEWDYFDPAKADEKRECGLHAAWGSKAGA